MTVEFQWLHLTISPLTIDVYYIYVCRPFTKLIGGLSEFKEKDYGDYERQAKWWDILTVMFYTVIHSSMSASIL